MTISTAQARKIAADWYSPRATGLVELATGSRPMSDQGALDLADDVDREIAQVVQGMADERDGKSYAGYRVVHLEQLQQLQVWAAVELDARGLV